MQSIILRIFRHYTISNKPFSQILTFGCDCQYRNISYDIQSCVSLISISLTCFGNHNI